jgi:hypothetical protein
MEQKHKATGITHMADVCYLTVTQNNQSHMADGRYKAVTQNNYSHTQHMDVMKQ